MTSLKNILKNTGLQLGLLGIISAIIIFVNFLDIPKYMTFDEVEFAKLALLLDNKPYTPYSTYATGHATLYFYIILLSFKVFGITQFALRLPSAVFGVLNPLIFYLIMKVIVNIDKWKLHIKEYVPFIFSLLLITSRWYINFARFGFEATFLLFLELASLLFTLQFISKKKNCSLIVAGIMAGLAYNSYQPGRVFFIIPLIILLLNKATLKQYVSFLMPLGVLATPLTLYLTQHPDIRMYQLFYPDNHEETLMTKIGWFFENIGKTISMFFFKGDMNGRHNYTGKAALNPVMGIAFVTGIYTAIKNHKNKYHLVFLSWLILSLIPTILTYPWENPNMLRTFTVIPPLIYLCGIAFLTLWEKMAKLRKPLRTAGMAFVFILIALSSWYELRTYFKYQSVVFLESFEAQKELLYYIQHPDKSVFEK